MNEETKKDITAITVGKDTYLLNPTSDGRGIRIENKSDSLFIPYGTDGLNLVNALREKVVGKGQAAKA